MFYSSHQDCQNNQYVEIFIMCDMIWWKNSSFFSAYWKNAERTIFVKTTSTKRESDNYKNECIDERRLDFWDVLFCLHILQKVINWEMICWPLMSLRAELSSKWHAVNELHMSKNWHFCFKVGQKVRPIYGAPFEQVVYRKCLNLQF